MANKYLGYDHGEVDRNTMPTIGDSTTSKEIELVILVGLSKDDVLKAIERYRDYINTGPNILGPTFLI